jgi:NAD(P)-dependent dehydrogenase (short-subunit alcohol dehydrogenase family)
LTKSAALEGAASGIRVNAIAPGPVETGMLNRFTGSAERKAGLVAGVPLKRVGTPEEIADAIVFVASRSRRPCVVTSRRLLRISQVYSEVGGEQ